MAAPLRPHAPSGQLPLDSGESPDFAVALVTAAAEATWLKRELEALSGAGKAAAKALAARVDTAPRGLLVRLPSTGPSFQSAPLTAWPGRQGSFARRDGAPAPPVDAFLGEALRDLGEGSGELGPPLTSALGVEALAPLADVLKARTPALRHSSELTRHQALAPLRVALGTTVLAAVATRCDSLVEGELASFQAAQARHAKARAFCDAMRTEYLGLKRGADAELRLRAARSLDDARAAVRSERAALARAAAAVQAARSTTLLDAAVEAGDAYVAYMEAATTAAASLPAVLAALRSEAAARRAAAAAQLEAAQSTAAAYVAAGEPLGSAAAAEEAGQGGSGTNVGQNLGRSHDGDIRRALAAGPGAVLKRGYLGKQARGYLQGWRRRFFVLDSAGTLTYYNDAQLVAAAAARLSGKPAHAPAPAPPPAPPPSPPAQEAAAGPPPKAGFGFKALNYIRNKAESVANGPAQAPAEAGGEEEDEDDKLAQRTVNLHLSTVKLEGDPADRLSRDAAFCFRLVSPGGSIVLQAESAGERDAWVAMLQGVIAELITRGGPVQSLSLSGKAKAAAASEAAAAAAGAGAAGLAVAQAVAQGLGNAVCADCGAADPDWASLSCCVVLCQQCAGAHRALGTHVSKVRSIALDAASWAPPVLELFAARVGNAGARAAWEAGRRAEEGPCVPEGADADARASAVRAKYEGRAHVAPRAREAAGGPDADAALCGAAEVGDALNTLRLLAAGVPASPAALQAAARAGDGAAACAALLLLNGADAAAVDADGATPAELAAAAGASEALLQLLQAAMAKAQA